MTAVLERLLVPRVFHRIKLDGPLSAREREFGESWLRHHPGWELKLWTRAGLPPLTNQALFDAAPPGQQEDILRYELLLAHGGVFLSTDLECLRNIEPLLGGVDVFCAREDGFRLADGVLGAAPGHPLIAAVVAALPDSVAWRAGRPRDEQTGAEMLTRIVAEQDGLGRVTPAVFGSEIFYPYHWTEPPREGATLPSAYAVCHWLSAFPADAPALPAPVSEAPATAAGTSAPVDRIVVDVDPDLVEPAAVVLAGAMELAMATPGMELALVVKGVPQVTEAVGDAMAGLMRQLAGGRDVPDIVVYGQPEGEGLAARARLAMSDDPAGNARTLLSLQTPAPAPASGLRGTYIGNGRMLVETAYGATLMVPSDDYGLMPPLVTRGAIEPALTGYLASQLRPGQTFADVGAGIGYFTVLAAQRVGGTGKVIAFEPDPAAAAVLRDNLAANRLTGHDVEVRADPVRLDDVAVDILKIDLDGRSDHTFAALLDPIRRRQIRRIVCTLGEDRKRLAGLLATIRDECGGRVSTQDAADRPFAVIDL
ncbi:FkbM family methyltransferase [Dactylosporangium sp. CA-052675]|uniref:FkbM family methyltransferase n=1 Tax=Dactylosporangium sp. CA-052675 TaxID=3239927 RepID=UPI003D8DB818